MSEEKGVIDQVQDLDVRLARGREGRTDLLGRTHTHNSQLDRERGRCRLKLLDRPWMKWRVWIPQHCNPGKPWDHLLEQLQPLSTELAHHSRETGDVAARVREVCHQAGSDWIADAGHDDGDSGRCALDRLGCERSVYYDHFDLALHQFGGQCRDLGIVAIRESPIDHHIAPLDIPLFAQRLSKRARLAALGRKDSEEYPDAPGRCWLLRIGGTGKTQ